MRISDWSSDVCSSDLVLFIAYFLPWFKVDFGLGSVSASGGDIGFLWSTLPMLIGLVMAGVIIASKLFGVKLPELPMPWSQVHLALGALAAILVVLKLIIGEDPTDRSEEHTSELQSLMRISYAVFCLKTKIIIRIYS